MSIYAIVSNRGYYYFSKRKKTKFVPLIKFSPANGTSAEEFHKLIELLEIKFKPNGTTKQQTDPCPNSLGGGNP